MLSSVIISLLSLVGTATSFFVFSSGGMLAQASDAFTSAVVENAAPTIKTLTISGNIGAPSSSFERTITFNGFANDQNNAVDITSISLVAWRDGNQLGSACTSDPNQCYRVPSCSFNTALGTDTEAWYQCSFSIPQAYSYGSWHAHLIVNDLDNATGTYTEAFPIDAFIFTTGPVVSAGPTGYYPPEEPVVVSPVTQVPSAGGVPAPADTPTPATNTQTPSTVTSGIDCIAEFYHRIEKPEPTIRRNPRHTEACSNALRVAHRDSGLLVFDVSEDPFPTKNTTRAIAVEVPSGASPVWFTLFAEHLSNQNAPRCSPLVGTIACSLINYTVINDSFFNVYAENHLGETLNSLNAALRITLVVPEDLENVPVRVYRLDAESALWGEIAIESYDAHTVTFRSTQLGIFAILGAEKPGIVERTTARLTTLFIIGFALLVLIGIILLILLALFKRRRAAPLQGPMRSSAHPHDPIIGNPNEPHTR